MYHYFLIICNFETGCPLGNKYIVSLGRGGGVSVVVTFFATATSHHVRSRPHNLIIVMNSGGDMRQIFLELEKKKSFIRRYHARTAQCCLLLRRSSCASSSSFVLDVFCTREEENVFCGRNNDRCNLTTTSDTVEIILVSIVGSELREYSFGDARPRDTNNKVFFQKGHAFVLHYTEFTFFCFLTIFYKIKLQQ
jgi:hypothetical protein